MSPDQLAFLLGIEAALSGPDPYSRVLQQTQERLGAEAGTVHLLGDGGDLVLAAHSPGLPPPVLAAIEVIPVGKGMAGLAVERAQPVQTCNLQTDATGDVRPGARQTELQGSIVVPILDGEEPMGALGVANHGEREFTPEETALLLEVGRRIARHARRAE